MRVRVFIKNLKSLKYNIMGTYYSVFYQLEDSVEPVFVGVYDELRIAESIRDTYDDRLAIGVSCDYHIVISELKF